MWTTVLGFQNPTLSEKMASIGNEPRDHEALKKPLDVLRFPSEPLKRGWAFSFATTNNDGGNKGRESDDHEGGHDCGCDDGTNGEGDSGNKGEGNDYEEGGHQYGCGDGTNGEDDGEDGGEGDGTGWVFWAGPDWLVEGPHRINLNQSSRTTKAPVENSNVRDPGFNHRFHTSSLKALRKLQLGSSQKTASAQLREFVRDLGTVRDITKLGLESAQSFLDGNQPSQLKAAYSFLHVAYAISQAGKGTANELEPQVFKEDLEVFRSCLPSTSEEPDQPSQQDLFDEIKAIMWQELQEGLQWVSSHDKSQFQSAMSSLTTVDAALLRVSHAPMGQAAIIVSLILETIVFQEFITIVSRLACHQLYFLYLSALAESLTQWMHYLPTSTTYSGGDVCVLCGCPNSLQATSIPCEICRITHNAISDTETDIIIKFCWRVASYSEERASRKHPTVLDPETSYPLSPFFSPPPPPASPPPVLLQRPVKVSGVSGVRRRRETRGRFRCSTCNKDFSSDQALSRHIGAKHDPQAIRQSMECGYQGCTVRRSRIVSTKYGVRDDNMRHHMKKDHRLDSEQLRVWAEEYAQRDS
ncbi:hypothetical protein TWF730_005127 [Orbilia blumenaviensis]|uniref:C2H2-type domain-containing protein n=1 Tax=Orbilia blumenaviensis TaxID=1796055 RepID=A0AAV9VHC7_9PEZI